MRFDSLPQWLAWQEKLHFTEIDPGLERIAAVWQRLNRDQPLPFKIITIAGTNGKGSSVALSTAILRAAGYKTGSYTSPHLLRYNERIAINDQPVSDTLICEAFARIDVARQDISLTYFEFATLAAVLIFRDAGVDFAILEVGMGGRLDAVNLFDADIALITPVDLDHMMWLGDNREKIGAEKAGILRSGRPVVCSEMQPPQSVMKIAAALKAPVFLAGRDFHYAPTATGWQWSTNEIDYPQLPLPALNGHYQLQNSAAAIMVAQLLQQNNLASISEAAICRGLQQVNLSGRFQILDGPVQRIFDVTHNQQGARNLAGVLKLSAASGRTYAVVAMLRDKDSPAVFRELTGLIDGWFLGGLIGERGQSAQALSDSLKSIDNNAPQQLFDTVEQAYHAAMQHAETGDRLLVFGSFHTIEAVMRQVPEIMASDWAQSA